jgi:hypothetical protein
MQTVVSQTDLLFARQVNDQHCLSRILYKVIEHDYYKLYVTDALYEVGLTLSKAVPHLAHRWL